MRCNILLLHDGAELMGVRGRFPELGDQPRVSTYETKLALLRQIAAREASRIKSGAALSLKW